MESTETKDLALVPHVIAQRIPREWQGGSGVGAGWFPLIEALDAEVAAIIPDYKVLQCKEKFGGLRYYVQFPEGTAPEALRTARAAIERAEVKSMKTCERCGKDGKSGGKGWIVTLCAEDRAKYEEERRALFGQPGPTRARWASSKTCTAIPTP